MTPPNTRRYYYGTTAVLKPGDEVNPSAGRPGAKIDPAEALSDAWGAADSDGSGVPHVYEVGWLDGRRLVVMGDVVLNGTLAWRALEIADNTRRAD
jgi:hypothetical protein